MRWLYLMFNRYGKEDAARIEKLNAKIKGLEKDLEEMRKKESFYLAQLSEAGKMLSEIADNAKAKDRLISKYVKLLEQYTKFEVSKND